MNPEIVRCKFESQVSQSAAVRPWQVLQVVWQLEHISEPESK